MTHRHESGEGSSSKSGFELPLQGSRIQPRWGSSWPTWHSKQQGSSFNLVERLLAADQWVTEQKGGWKFPFAPAALPLPSWWHWCQKSSPLEHSSSVVSGAACLFPCLTQCTDSGILFKLEWIMALSSHQWHVERWLGSWRKCRGTEGEASYQWLFLTLNIVCKSLRHVPLQPSWH